MRALAALLLVVGWNGPAFAEPTQIGGLAVDLPAHLARNEVVYLAPAREGWQGLPLGNGRLGAIQWQPDDLLLELNSALSGVYGGAIGRIHLKTTPGMTAAVQSYTQRLAPGQATVSTVATYPQGRLSAETFIAADADVVVFDVEDTRPGAVHRLEIEAWRKTASVRIEDGALVLSDHLSTAGEPDYRFVLVVAIDAKTPVTPRAPGVLETAGARYTAYAAFADTRDPRADVMAAAKAGLAAARRRGLEAVRGSHREWWHRFWSRSLVHLTSADGVADYLESCWTMHLYAMGAGSRGEVPPKFNGGLWIHNRDQREWGTSYWHWNQQEATWPIFAAGQLELHRPYQNLYWGMLPEVKKWTKEMYGLEGAQIQETIPFHGRMPH